MKTTEELLRPRYKVMADYPDSHYSVGSILDRDWSKYPNGDETKEPIWRISDFPHLFLTLEWWEDRDLSDFPDYVWYRRTIKAEPVCLKVAKHFTNSFDKPNPYGFVVGENELDWEYKSYYRTKPATEQEYNEYQKSQKV